MADNVHIERIDGDGHTFNFNFSKAESYQKMQEDLRDLEEIFEDISESNTEKRLKYSKRINRQKELINVYKEEVLRLADTFSRITVNTERLKQAKAYFEEGKLGEADAILKTEELESEQSGLLDAKQQKAKELETIEEELRSNATEFLLKAQLRATQFDDKRIAATSAFYEQALVSHRGTESLNAYVNFLTHHEQFKKAQPLAEEAVKLCRNSAKKSEVHQEKLVQSLNDLAGIYERLSLHSQSLPLYEESLNISKTLSANNPEAYLPTLTSVLNGFALFYYGQNKLLEAQKLYEKALEINRKLSEQSPEKYRAGLASNLSNLAIIFKYQERLEEAFELHREALNICKELAEENSEKYAPQLGTSYNNIAEVYRVVGQLDSAIKAFEAALEIYRRLSQQNPEAYLPSVAMVLDNLAVTFQEQGQLTQAQEAFEEIIKIYKVLAEENPQIYNYYVVTALSNLALLLDNQEQLVEAKPVYEEALAFYRRLNQEESGAYLKAISDVQNNFGILCMTLGHYQEAKDACEESLNIRRNLFEEDMAYLPFFFQSAVNLAAFHTKVEAYYDGELAVALCSEVINIAQNLEDTSMVEGSLGTAVQILQAWNAI